MTENVQSILKFWTDLETNMTSVERSLEYTIIDQENQEGQSIKSWPKSGKISFRNLTLCYGSSRITVLKNITFDARPGHKIGIIGRTGAGKSSIISTIYRLYDFEGSILIDDVNISEISLNTLR